MVLARSICLEMQVTSVTPRPPHTTQTHQGIQLLYLLTSFQQFIVTMQCIHCNTLSVPKIKGLAKNMSNFLVSWKPLYSWYQDPLEKRPTGSLLCFCLLFPGLSFSVGSLDPVPSQSQSHCGLPCEKWVLSSVGLGHHHLEAAWGRVCVPSLCSPQ